MAERRNYDRVDRVAQQVKEILSQLLIYDIQDPQLQQVELTEVKVSGDFQVATIYWVPLQPGMDEKACQSAFERAGGFFRKKLGDEMRMRHTPELRFKYDRALEQGRRIESLINELEIPPEDSINSEET